MIVGGNGERRTLRIAAELGDACNLTTSDPDVVRHKVGVLRAHCADVGRDPAEVAVTVLDLPVVGRDRDDVWARVERLRGRTAAAAYAARTHAGTVAEHRAGTPTGRSSASRRSSSAPPTSTAPRPCSTSRG